MPKPHGGSSQQRGKEKKQQVVEETRQQTLEEQEETKGNTLNSLEKKSNKLESEKALYNKRKEVEKKKTEIENCIKWKTFTDLRKSVKDTRDKDRVVKDKVKVLEDKRRPLKDVPPAPPGTHEKRVAERTERTEAKRKEMLEKQAAGFAEAARKKAEAEQGFTALHHAVGAGHVAAVKALLASGALSEPSVELVQELAALAKEEAVGEVLARALR